MEKANQEAMGIQCNVAIDGYTDFIILNRFGEAQNQGMLNKELKKSEFEGLDAFFKTGKKVDKTET